MTRRNLSAISLIVLLAAHSRAVSFDDDLKSLKGHDVAARKAAAEHLHKGGRAAISAVVKGLDGADDENKGMYLDLLRSIKHTNKGLTAPEADTKTLARIGRGEKDRSVRFRIIDTVREVGDTSAVSELERFASEDPEERIRAEATHFVGSRSGKNLPFFRKQAKDPSSLVRRYAEFELARLGDKSGRESSLLALKDSKEGDERRMAISTLAEIGAPGDAAILRQISKSPAESYSMKILATKAAMTIDLLQMQQSERLAFLMKSLDDPDALVRDWAYSRLWNFPDPATNIRLQKYLSEPGHRGYKEAQDALSSR